MPGLIASCVVALALGAATFAPTDFQDLSADFSACLSSGAISSPAVAPQQAPPGLATGLQNLQIAKFARGAHSGFAYEADLGAGRVCGVALYGPVDAAVGRQVVEMIERSQPPLKPASDQGWSITAPPAHKRYWGDPLAPTLRGVLLLERPPSPVAPSLDVQYHVVLVR